MIVGKIFFFVFMSEAKSLSWGYSPKWVGGEEKKEFEKAGGMLLQGHLSITFMLIASNMGHICLSSSAHGALLCAAAGSSDRHHHEKCF